MVKNRLWSWLLGFESWLCHLHPLWLCLNVLILKMGIIIIVKRRLVSLGLPAEGREWAVRTLHPGWHRPPHMPPWRAPGPCFAPLALWAPWDTSYRVGRNCECSGQAWCFRRGSSPPAWLHPSSQFSEASRAGSPHFTGEETRLKIIKYLVSSGARTPGQAFRLNLYFLS